MRKKKFIYLILIIVFLLIGFLVGKISEQKIWQGKLSQAQKELSQSQKELSQSQKESDSLKSQLENFYPPLPKEVKSVSGEIKKIEDKNLLIEAQIRVSQFPLPEGEEIERKDIKVNTNDQTKIFKIEMIEIPLPPEEPFKKISINFEDLKVGDPITVTSEEQIKGKTEILASQIQVIR